MSFNLYDDLKTKLIEKIAKSLKHLYKTIQTDKSTAHVKYDVLNTPLVKISGNNRLGVSSTSHEWPRLWLA